MTDSALRAPYNYDVESGWCAYGARYGAHYRPVDGQPASIDERFAAAGIRWYVDSYGKLYVECLPDVAYELLSGFAGRFNVGFEAPPPVRPAWVDTETIATMIGRETTVPDVNALLEAEGLLKRKPRLEPTSAADGFHRIETTERGRRRILWSVDVMYSLVGRRADLEHQRADERTCQNRPVELVVRFPATCSMCGRTFLSGELGTWRAIDLRLTCVACETRLSDTGEPEGV